MISFDNASLGWNRAYVSTGEVTTLKHEAGDDTVEARVLVAETLLSGAEGTEVLNGFGDFVVEEVHNDAALVSWKLLAFTSIDEMPHHIDEERTYEEPTAAQRTAAAASAGRGQGRYTRHRRRFGSPCLRMKIGKIW